MPCFVCLYASSGPMGPYPSPQPEARIDGQTDAQKGRCIRSLSRSLCTVHVKIIPGGPNVRISFWHSPGQPQMRLSNSDARRLYIWLLQQVGFLVEIREVLTICSRIWDFDATPNPRVSRPEKTNPPPGADFPILPSGYYYAICK